MRINHNIAALNTHRQLNSASAGQAKSMEKLSSGLRINRAGDDAAGLAISEKMRGQIRGLDQASRNAQDGISLIQTGEGALNETHDILQRMRELAVQSSNDTNTNDDRLEIQKEVTQLAEEVTRIAKNTEFNTQNLLDGNFSGKFQIGSNAGQNISISIDAMDAATLQVGTGGATTYTGGSVTDKTGDATALTIAVGTYAGADATDVAVDTSSVTSTTAYTSADANITSSTVNNQYAQLNLTWTDDGGADGDIQAAEVAIGGSASAGWSVSDVTSKQITLTNTNGDTFVYDATATNGQALSSGVAGADFAFDQAGTTTYGGTVTVGAGDDATVFNVNGDGTATVQAGSATKTYAGLAISGATATGSGTGSFDISGRVEGATTPVTGIDVSSQAAANTAITSIDAAIKTVSGQRSELGAYQNRLEHTINNLNTSSENLTAAESRVRDVDYALAA
ncbi:flagellin N-terminal helical domain-containing protein [Litchfieldia alkalitelluris]|uniref:flagellin N-terminal helical domain-containing protein n=1 Tax=Litchfieldia alkalitelluris TaxID=304268 RepID=UPI000996E2E3|nr:flagellin [Litchfieldia alkalitelluris]